MGGGSEDGSGSGGRGALKPYIETAGALPGRCLVGKQEDLNARKEVGEADRGAFEQPPPCPGRPEQARCACGRVTTRRIARWLRGSRCSRAVSVATSRLPRRAKADGDSRGPPATGQFGQSAVVRGVNVKLGMAAADTMAMGLLFSTW